MSTKTRASSNLILFGPEKDIDAKSATVLPTYEDVLRCFGSVRLQLKGDESKQPPSSAVAELVAQKLEEIWQRASLPTLSRPRIKDMILNYNTKYQTAIKPLKSRDTPALRTKLETFKSSAKNLFDICSCKCINKISCKCIKPRKIPDIEWQFINDQRNERNMMIGNIDIEVTNKLQRKLSRQNHDLLDSSVPSTSGLNENKNNVNSFAKNDASNSSSSNTDDDEFKWSYPLENKGHHKQPGREVTQMRLSLSHTAKAADLTGVSNRAAAHIACAVLEDMCLIRKNNPVNVVDKNKIRREIEKNRNQLRCKEMGETEHLEGLYFDGRKDQTIIHMNNRRMQILEEHIALIKEPSSTYFGHLALTPPVKAVDIANGIISFMEEQQIDLSQLKVIGCDSTNVNTGWRGGVIRLIEERLGRPLQWAICLLHANELPLRHLLQKLDGHTKGPYNYSGPIDLRLNDCEKLLLFSLNQFIRSYLWSM